MKKRKHILALVIFVFVSSVSFSQSDTTGKALYDTIYYMDSIFFKAFNTCDTTLSKILFTEDLEFYHDTEGRTNYYQNLASIRYRCTNKTKVRRELVVGTLEVYPIGNYGAIETGQHNFYYTPPGKEEIFDGTFKFLHIWEHNGDKWQISRVVSYAH